ncbi:MAG TPA: hypothetical protein VG325_13905 [Solirubrobacteraceae bacterium]|nr:hypothetical protein [Solirubrobacteraceae bacterium]
MRVDDRPQGDVLAGGRVGPGLPGQLLRATRMAAGGVEQVVEGVRVGRLARVCEPRLQVLVELVAADLRQPHLHRFAEDRLAGALQHHLQHAAGRPREEQGHGPPVTGARQRRADGRDRVSRAMAQSLELVEDHDEVAGDRPQDGELVMERLGVLLRTHRPAADHPVGDPDVEAELGLRRPQPSLRRAPQPPVRCDVMASWTHPTTPATLTTRSRLTRITSNGGASAPCGRASSSASRWVNVVVPVCRGANSATFLPAFNVSAMVVATPSMPMIVDASSSGRSQMNGFSAGSTGCASPRLELSRDRRRR